MDLILNAIPLSPITKRSSMFRRTHAVRRGGGGGALWHSLRDNNFNSDSISSNYISWKKSSGCKNSHITNIIRMV